MIGGLSRELATALAAGAVLVAAFAAPAGAEVRTLGSNPAPEAGGCNNCTFLQAATDPGSPSYVVPPGDWTITSWSMAGGVTTAGQARLVVWRPVGIKGFEVVGLSPLESIPPNTTPSFAANIPVQPGDIISNAGGAASGDVPIERATGAMAGDVRFLVDTGAMQVSVGQTAGFVQGFSTYRFNFYQPVRLLNISAVIDGEPPPPPPPPPAETTAPASTPPAVTQPATPTKKKCKKGFVRKKVNGKKKCVRKKK